eukprot:GHVQ01005041.1.p1 GENE.GHVQ01005041.1~~GHVQ01005041.1.p1  ORF type:complete len:120 (-),score=19.75 GHVQ01005041.1:529-888(-)
MTPASPPSSLARLSNNDVSGTSSWGTCAGACLRSSIPSPSFLPLYVQPPPRLSPKSTVEATAELKPGYGNETDWRSVNRGGLCLLMGPKKQDGKVKDRLGNGSRVTVEFGGGVSVWKGG